MRDDGLAWTSGLHEAVPGDAILNIAGASPSESVFSTPLADWKPVLFGSKPPSPI
jgi:hypothetical protein